MAGRVTLTVIQGQLTGQVFTFDERTTCIVGRAADCFPQLPSDDDHRFISRHHCLLDINPPDIRVRDFGSKNGTFVNGQKIGQRDRAQTPEQGAESGFPEYDLQIDNEIKLGSTVFRVGVQFPAVCARCGLPLADTPRELATEPDRMQVCDACRTEAFQTLTATPFVPASRMSAGPCCAHCGRDVSAEIGEHRAGEFVCADCKANPMRIVQQLLEQARQGTQELRPIQGYTILKELGQGGMGAVFLARHGETGQQVALKVMLPQVAADRRARVLFLRETENTKALRHPHLVQLLDYGCADGVFFFTLEYCDGGSLDQLVQARGGRLPLEEAAPLLLQVLEGLEAAHNAEVPQVKRADGSYGPGRGLVHRDLKPHNIYLCGNPPIAKVGDYGLGKAFDTAGLSGQTRTGTLAGTPVFMPRQQVVNFKYAKPEVDVWAAAATLYFVLTGKPPREFPPHRDPWQIVLTTDAVPIRQRDSSVPARLAEVLDLALRDQPEIPFKTATEFRQALADALP